MINSLLFENSSKFLSLFQRLKVCLQCFVAYVIIKFNQFNARSRMKKKRRLMQGSESKDSDGTNKSETKSISEVVCMIIQCSLYL